MKALFVLSLAVLLYASSAVAQQDWPEGRIDEVMQLIKDHYIPPIVDLEACKQKILEQGLAGCLDRYSWYVPSVKEEEVVGAGAKGVAGGAPTKEKVKAPTEVTYRVVHGLGYIKVKSFYWHMSQEFAAALHDLVKNKHVPGLVIDLRGNGGGLTTNAIQSIWLFAKKGDVIFSVRGRTTDVNMDYKAPRDGPYRRLPVVILQDPESASSSEVFGGALQLDHKTVVGWRSHGKGTGQCEFPFKDGMSLWITSFDWYLPDGRQVKPELAIEPDIVFADNISAKAALNRAFAILRDKIAGKLLPDKNKDKNMDQNKGPVASR